MSKMTSSIHAADSLAKRRPQASTAVVLEQQQHQQQKQHHLDIEQRSQSCNSAIKPFTDFSIESIIGGARLLDCDQMSRVASGGHLPGGRLAHAIDNQYSRLDIEGLKDDTHDSTQKDLNSLQSNMGKRERPKHFQCNWCPFKFSNNGQLRNHERIHTGERPFRCDRAACGRTFTRNEELTRHKLIHSGMRPHICRYCEKRFGRKDHLKKHERTHEKRKSSRRSQASRASAQLNQTRHQLDMFLPKKLDYDSRHPSLPIQTCYHIPFSIPPTRNPSDPYYNQQNPPTLAATQNDLITSQIVSLARAASTNTMTVGIPSLGATQAIMTSASNAMQQLATNYLHSWFNVVGQSG